MDSGRAGRIPFSGGGPGKLDLPELAYHIQQILIAYTGPALYVMH